MKRSPALSISLRSLVCWHQTSVLTANRSDHNRHRNCNYYYICPLKYCLKVPANSTAESRSNVFMSQPSKWCSSTRTGITGSMTELLRHGGYTHHWAVQKHECPLIGWVMTCSGKLAEQSSPMSRIEVPGSPILALCPNCLCTWAVEAFSAPDPPHGK